MSLSPSLIDDIVVYEKNNGEKNLRSNRALFDLRDKRKREEKGRGYYALMYSGVYTYHDQYVNKL